MAAPRGEHGRAYATWSDEELVAQLATRDWHDPLWQFFLAECAAPMIGTLHARILRGTAGSKIARLGPRLELSAEEHRWLRADDDLRHGLVDDAVITCFERFEVRLRRRRAWRTDGGATLRTYMVNGAFLCLVDGLRAWRSQRKETQRVAAADPTELRDHCLIEDGGDVFAHLDGSDAWDLLDLIHERDPLLARAVLMKFDSDLTWGEIASRLGLTTRALTRRLARMRAHFDHDRRQGRRDD